MHFSNQRSIVRIYILAFIAVCLVLLSARSFLPVPKTSFSSTSTSSPDATTQPTWLLITSSASADFQRRLLIRWTWVSLFRHAGIFDHTFAVACTDPTLLPVIKKENETFGDILLLDNVKDDYWTANHIKPFEFFKKVTTEGWNGKTYDFVSKVDQDSFVDPVRTWNKYLKGRIDESDVEEKRLMMSMPHEGCNCPAPQGGFYTLSWDLAKVISRLYSAMGNTDNIGPEDCMMGRLPTDANEQYEFIPMDGEESFDVVGEVGGAIGRDWSKAQVERGGLEVLKKVIFLHQMKEEWKWLAVKEFFDADGWVPNRNSGRSNLKSLQAHSGSKN